MAKIEASRPPEQTKHTKSAQNGQKTSHEARKDLNHKKLLKKWCQGHLLWLIRTRNRPKIAKIMANFRPDTSLGHFIMCRANTKILTCTVYPKKSEKTTMVAKYHGHILGLLKKHRKRLTSRTETAVTKRTEKVLEIGGEIGRYK